MISIWRLRCDMNCRYQIMFSAIRIAISRPHYSISQIIGHQIFVTVITCIRCFIWRIDSISRNFSQNDFSSKTSPEDTMCDMRWSFIRLSIFVNLTFFRKKRKTFSTTFTFLQNQLEKMLAHVTWGAHNFERRDWSF